ncbi:MAG: Beta-lactamase [Labilithrix sp.]|nr:Beta-lactamase [Labilithrix sp.]
MLEYVLEYVTGKSFAAPNGSPGQHGASLLSNFTYNELGSFYGIERSHTALGARDVAEPEYRHWSTPQLTYYPTEKDAKRPWCALENGSCNFSKFDANILHNNRNWSREYVDFTYSSVSAFAGAGALAAEAPQFLEFMSRFAVSHPYGASRALIDGKLEPTQHLGGLDGTRSWVFQSNGKPMAYFKLGTKRDGEWSYDLGEDSAATCTLPKGVDVFFAMNQSNDAKCTEAEKCVVDDPNASDGKTSAYTRYINVLKEALCKADWSSLPTN